jgi:putative selenium metabolism hydrolase
MAPIIIDLETLNQRLADHPILGKGTLAVTDIRSSAPSLCAVADAATIHIDRRLTAGEDEETACSEIRALPSFQKAKASIEIPEYDVESYTGMKLHVRSSYPMWMMEEDHPLVRMAVDVHGQTIGGDPDRGPWTFSTNGVATKGIFDIPTIGLGPGEEVHAHAPTDQVNVEQLTQALVFYTAFCLSWAQSS